MHGVSRRFGDSGLARTERNFIMSRAEFVATVTTTISFGSAIHSEISRHVRISVIPFGGLWFCRFTDANQQSITSLEPMIVPFQHPEAALSAGIQAVLKEVSAQVSSTTSGPSIDS